MAKEYETPPTIVQLIVINNKLAKSQRDLQAANTLLREECRILAMLASDKPEFTNPTVVVAAKNLRDRILKGNSK